jgi:phosphatidylglycerol:prolipoprotein diacylglycerol transferase
MAIGFLLAIWIAGRRARRAGLEPGTIITLALIGGPLGYFGARAMHVLHYAGGAVRRGEIGAGQAISQATGLEVMGGVVLGVVGVIVYLRRARKPVAQYLDVVFPPMILAMGIGRLGCLMYGCCWGAVCATDAGKPALPWAIRFPYGSPVYERQWEEKKLSPPEELLWTSPQTKSREPIPRALLERDERVANEIVRRYVDNLEARAALGNADSQSAEVIQARHEAAALKANLPGKTDGEKADYVAAALHLRRWSAKRGAPLTLADLRTLAAAEHSQWVHPTQIYDAFALALLFLVLSVIHARRPRAGTVVAWTMMLYPLNRFAQEFIRADNPHDVGGLTISQFLSLAVFLAGIVLAIILAKSAPPAASPSLAASP